MIDYEYEQQLGYLSEVVENPHACDWAAACNYLGTTLHPDSVRKAFACTRYGGYAVYKYFMHRLQENSCLGSEEELRRLEELKDSIYTERVRNSDKVRELRAAQRVNARFENLRDTLVEELRMTDKIDVVPCLTYTPVKDSEASLLISDIHLGLKVDNQFNYYDAEEVKRKLDILTEKTIKYCDLHKVNKLYVELLGDLISGLIQFTSRCDQEEDIIQQTMIMAELLSGMIGTLKVHIPEIVVLGVPGNHGRAIADKKQNLDRENFEKLIYAYIKARLPEDITVITSHTEDFIYYTIAGRKVVLTHGHNDKPENAKLHYCNLLKEHVDEIHMGHYHAQQIIDDCDTDIVINGAMLGTDSYTIQLRKNTKPSQTLRVYSLTDRDVCTYKITFD